MFRILCLSSNDTFVEKHFVDKTFVETFRRQNFVDNHFVDKTFRRQDISSTNFYCQNILLKVNYFLMVISLTSEHKFKSVS
jgi:hypothetical protein